MLPPALVAVAHSVIVTVPALVTEADQVAPTPGVLCGEATTAILVAAFATEVVFCTQVPAVVAVAKAALVAVSVELKFCCCAVNNSARKTQPIASKRRFIPAS
jgi:hypothetical protein